MKNHHQAVTAIRLKRYAWLLAVVWTILMAGSIIQDIVNTKTSTHEAALQQARQNFEKDLSIRAWVADHGGVYVPVDDHTPPNPYLAHLPERDIVTPSGVQLTLMNPAYVTRQLYEEYSYQFGVQGHLTSLNPLNPTNVADPWEREALLSFEQGQTEAVDSVEIDGEPYLRLMRPFVTEEPCLACHASQGYQVGDIRGGISISVPLAPFKAREQFHLLAHTPLFFGIWLVGITVLGWAGRRLTTQMQRQEQIELEFQAVEARNRALLEALPDLLFVFDGQGKFLDYKASSHIELFLSPDQFLGRSVTEVIPDRADQIMRNLRLALQTGQMQTYQYQLPSPGEESSRHYEARMSRVSSEQVLTLIKDITEQEEALAALQASRASLARAQQIARLGNWEWDIHTDESNWSDELFRIFGVPRRENGVGIETFLSHIHPDDRTMVSQAVDEALYGNQPYNLDHRIIRPDGVVRVVHEQGEVIRDKQTGQPLKMLGTTQDVTEQKEAETARKSLMSRLETLIHNLQSGILMEDVHRRVVLHNETFNVMFGLPASVSIEGEDCTIAAEELKMMFVEAETFSSRITEIVRQQQQVVGEELHTVDGRVLERDYVPVYTEGRLIGHLWHYRDITERVRTREQIKASLQEKEILLKEIHHRVKNNLQIIASLLYLQSNRLDDPAALSALHESRSRIRSMALIHEQLYQSLNLAAIDFHNYLSSLISYLAQTYRNGEPRVDIFVQARDIKLEIDTAIPLGLIVNELVSNTLKHAFPNNQTGQVHVELIKPQPNICKLTVRDNGIGFPPNLVARVAGEGLQVLSSHSLGTQLVDMLVTQLDGEITAYNDGGAVVEMSFSQTV